MRQWTISSVTKGKTLESLVVSVIPGFQIVFPCIIRWRSFLSFLGYFFPFYGLSTPLITPKGKKRINKALFKQSKQFLLFYYFSVKRTEFQNSVKDLVLASGKCRSVTAWINPWLGNIYIWVYILQKAFLMFSISFSYPNKSFTNFKTATKNGSNR